MNLSEISKAVSLLGLTDRRTRYMTRRGNRVTRIHCGRQECDVNNAAGYTWEFGTVAAASFFRIRYFFSQSCNAAGTTTDQVPFLASVAVVPDLSDATLDAASWKRLSFSGAATAKLPKAPAQFRRAIVPSDWLDVSSVAPGNGTKLPYVACRTWMNGGTLTLTGKAAGAQSFLPWATHPTHPSRCARWQAITRASPRPRLPVMVPWWPTRTRASVSR